MGQFFAVFYNWSITMIREHFLLGRDDQCSFGWVWFCFRSGITGMYCLITSSSCIVIICAGVLASFLLCYTPYHCSSMFCFSSNSLYIIFVCNIIKSNYYSAAGTAYLWQNSASIICVVQRIHVESYRIQHKCSGITSHTWVESCTITCSILKVLERIV